MKCHGFQVSKLLRMVYEFYLEVFYDSDIKLSMLMVLKWSNEHGDKKFIDGCLCSHFGY